MLSEHTVVFNPDDVVCVLGVVVSQVEEDFELDSRLVLQLFLVPDDLYSHNLACFVVQAFESLAKGPLS